MSRTYTEELLANCPRPICVVGNAAMTQPYGRIIDAYATVIRMNNYRIAGFEELVGAKTDLRCVNAWTDIEHRDEVPEFTPFTAGAPESANLRFYNERNRSAAAAARADVHPFIPETPNPSTGLALIQLLACLGIRADVFGFDGFATNHYWAKDAGLGTTHSSGELACMRRRRNVNFAGLQSAELSIP